MKTVIRSLLSVALLFSGVAHLTFAREDFASQVPGWIPIESYILVSVSGVLELMLGAGLLAWGRVVPLAGLATALFYAIAVFPVRVTQLIEGIDVFWFDTDELRLLLVLIQPVIIYLAFWSTSAFSVFKKNRKNSAVGTPINQTRK